MMALDIRPERAEDAAAIRALVTAAFGDNETASFVDAVRAEAEICLAEVAVAQGIVVGHSQWCSAPLIVDGTAVKAAYLTCVSVQPALQRRGIGSCLVQTGLRRLTDIGYAAVTLLGDPAY